MDNETIYTVLLDQPRRNGDNTMHGFSYRLERKENGKIILKEIGSNELVIWDADGPELDALNEATVKSMVEAALPVDADYVIPPPSQPYVPVYSPEDWTARFFTAPQILALQRFEFALQAGGKPLGPKMAALKGWLETMLLASADPTPRTFSEPPYGYAETAQEAIAALSAVAE